MEKYGINNFSVKIGDRKILQDPNKAEGAMLIDGGIIVNLLHMIQGTVGRITDGVIIVNLLHMIQGTVGRIIQ